MWGAIISGVSGLAQGVANSITSRRNTDKTIQANKQMAEYQYSKDLEMWQKQNEYNNPANQMMRLKEAGLNPNMVYGSKGVTGNTSSQMPKYNAPRLDYNYQPVVQNLPSVLSQFQDFTLKNAQMDNMAEQNKILKEEAEIRRNEAEFSDRYYRGRGLGSLYSADRKGLRFAVDSGASNYMDFMGNKMDVAGTLQGRYAQSQLDYKKEGVRRMGVGINAMKQNMDYMDLRIDYQKKVNELYNTIAYSKLGFGLANQVMKVAPGGKLMKGAGRAGSLGKMSSATKRILNNKWQSWRK